MVYISNGAIVQGRPWSVQRIKDLISGFFNFLIMFFRTMLDFSQWSGSDMRGNRRGGNDDGGPPGGGPRRRPIGRPMTLSDCTIAGGG